MANPIPNPQSNQSAIRNPQSAIKFRLADPTRVLVEREVTYVQGEDLSGRFGILPRHEPFLTALVPSILIYRYAENGRQREAYVAVRGGVLRVTRDGVQVAVRDAHLSDDLAGLQEEIRKNRKTSVARSYRSTRSMYQMQIAAWRRLMEFEHVPAR